MVLHAQVGIKQMRDVQEDFWLGEAVPRSVILMDLVPHVLLEKEQAHNSYLDDLQNSCLVTLFYCGCSIGVHGAKYLCN